MSPAIALLAVAAARHVPPSAAEVLARSVVFAVELGEPLRVAVASAIEAVRKSRGACRAAGGTAWIWPEDVPPELVAAAMIEAAS